MRLRLSVRGLHACLPARAAGAGKSTRPAPSAGSDCAIQIGRVVVPPNRQPGAEDIHQASGRRRDRALDALPALLHFAARSDHIAQFDRACADHRQQVGDQRPFRRFHHRLPGLPKPWTSRGCSPCAARWCETRPALPSCSIFHGRDRPRPCRDPSAFTSAWAFHSHERPARRLPRRRRCGSGTLRAGRRRDRGDPGRSLAPLLVASMASALMALDRKPAGAGGCDRDWSGMTPRAAVLRAFAPHRLADHAGPRASAEAGAGVSRPARLCSVAATGSRCRPVRCRTGSPTHWRCRPITRSSGRTCA